MDTWWQTETGAAMITPLPGAWPCLPGSATLPFFGVLPVILDDKVMLRHSHWNDKSILTLVAGIMPRPVEATLHSQISLSKTADRLAVVCQGCWGELLKMPSRARSWKGRRRAFWR